MYRRTGRSVIGRSESSPQARDARRGRPALRTGRADAACAGVLLAFLLAPIVNMLQRAGSNRAIAVALTISLSRCGTPSDMQKASDRPTSVGASTVVGNSAQAVEEITWLRQPLIQGVQADEEVATTLEA
jgi:hypothetical protein